MRTLIGGILMAVGILIAGASGLCTLMIVGSSMFSGEEWARGGLDGMAGSIAIVLIFGGIPFAVGVALFWLGRKMMRGDASPKEEPTVSAADPAKPEDKQTDD